MNTKRLFITILFIFLLFILCIIFMFFYTNKLIENDRVYKITNYSLDGENDNMHYRLLKNSSKNKFIFKTFINKKDLNKINADNYKIIFYRIAGQWFKVYFNNKLIGSAGNLLNDRSNIWNSINVYDIDKNFISENNELIIEIYSTYEVGTLSFPVLITDSIIAAEILNWFNLILINIYKISIGAILVTFFLLLFLFAATNSIKIGYVFYSVASLLLVVYIYDNINIYYLPFSLLLFKKLIISALYLAVSLISFAIYSLFKKPINFILGLLPIIFVLYMIFFIDNIILLKKVSNIFAFLIIINILGWILSSLTDIRKSTVSKIIFMLCVTSCILSIYDFYFIVFEKYGKYNLISLNIYGIIFFSIVIIMLVVFDFIVLQKKIAFETEKSKTLYDRSTKDQMTDCYNHQFITDKLKELEGIISVIMFDIDNFKPINDNFGHQTGDFVIKTVALNIKKNVRNLDFVARYGGDEFLSVLPGCPVDEAFNIALNTQNDLKKINSDPKGNKINITLSIGICFTEKNKHTENILHNADLALYKSKRNGKDQINIFKGEL